MISTTYQQSLSRDAIYSMRHPLRPWLLTSENLYACLSLKNVVLPHLLVMYLKIRVAGNTNASSFLWVC